MGVSADTSCDARVASIEPYRWAGAGMHGGRFGEPLVVLRAATPCLVPCLHSRGSDPNYRAYVCERVLCREHAEQLWGWPRQYCINVS